MPDPAAPTDTATFGTDRRVEIQLLVALGALIGCWMLLMPPGATPDEPAHVVRAGAIAQGDFADRPEYELPDRYVVAEPACYAFTPEFSASCAGIPVSDGSSVVLATAAGGYPPTGHAWYAAFTRLPVLDPIWWARIGGALAATGLIGWSVLQLRVTQRSVIGPLMLGITPLAWSLFGTVNPSALTIAGAVALWVGLITVGRSVVDGVAAARPALPLPDAAWLTAIGFVFVASTRRDGMAWACIAALVGLGLTSAPALGVWRRLRRGPAAVVAVTTVGVVLWGLTSDVPAGQFVWVPILALPAFELARRWWQRTDLLLATRIAAVSTATVAAIVAAYYIVRDRRGGWDGTFVAHIVMQTDDNLVEAIGIMGWLDTPVPAPVIGAWFILIGMLVAAVLVDGDRRVLGWAAALAGLTAVSAWMLELVQGGSSGVYWQGRYSMPLLVGIPLVLGTGVRHRQETTRVLTVSALVGSLVLSNVALWAAGRRFGVGVEGSWAPWRWDTLIQPVPPIVLLVVHAAASVAFVRIVSKPCRPS